MQDRLIVDLRIAEWVAASLLQGNAFRWVPTGIRSEWFTWKSGIKAPVYCNVRQLTSFPPGRDSAIAGLHHALGECFPLSNGVVGMATAGISWAAMLAHLANLPMGYVRSVPKSHGLGKIVEYDARPGRVVILDDLVASGGSITAAIRALEERGHEVLGVLSIVNWGFEEMRSNLAGYKVKALVSYPQIISRLDLPSDAEADLHAFYKNPSNHVWTSRLFSESPINLAA